MFVLIVPSSALFGLVFSDGVTSTSVWIGHLLPKLLYTDYSCCNGKPGSPRVDSGTSVAALWRSIFDVKLDAMHLMLCIGRESTPGAKRFLVDLSQAIFSQHLGNRQQLIEARKAARLEGPPTRTERVNFIRRVVGEPESVAKRMTLVLKVWYLVNIVTACYYIRS